MNDYLKKMELYRMIPFDSILEIPSFEQLQLEIEGYIHYIKPGNSYRNIRTKPSIAGSDIGDLYAYEGIRFYPDSKKDNWYYIQKLNSIDVSGWILIDGIELIFVQKYLAEHAPSTYMKLEISGYNLNVTTTTPE